MTMRYPRVSVLVFMAMLALSALARAQAATAIVGGTVVDETASNNAGAWNETSTCLDVSVDPAHYQAAWFRLLVVAAVLALLAALQLRLRRVARHFNTRLQARVGERTRIARHLHDTLLQSFHGVLLKIQAGVNLLPDR